MRQMNTWIIGGIEMISVTRNGLNKREVVNTISDETVGGGADPIVSCV